MKCLFFGNGVMTWIISPFKFFADKLAIPFQNKDVHELEDRPKECQRELNHVLGASRRANFLPSIEGHLAGRGLVMLLL